MSSSSEDEESSEESSCPSEWSDDDERSYDQEDSDIDKDTEKHRSSRRKPTKVTLLRGKQKRKGRRDDETSSDQEESDQDEEAEKDWHDRGGEPKVASRGHTEQERRRKRKREPEDRISSDQEETDQEEENRTSQNKLEKHRQDEGASQIDERVRKKLRGGQSSETVAGIIYLSRVPPFMKPHKVKHLLSRYGSVGRVYLKPEGQF